MFMWVAMQRSGCRKKENDSDFAPWTQLIWPLNSNPSRGFGRGEAPANSEVSIPSFGGGSYVRVLAVRWLLPWTSAVLSTLTASRTSGFQAVFSPSPTWICQALNKGRGFAAKLWLFPRWVWSLTWSRSSLCGELSVVLIFSCLTYSIPVVPTQAAYLPQAPAWNRRDCHNV